MARAHTHAHTHTHTLTPGLPSECSTSFIYERVVWTGRRRAPTGTLIGASACPAPRKGCMVCGKAQLHLQIDTAATTLAQLLDKASACAWLQRGGGEGARVGGV